METRYFTTKEEKLLNALKVFREELSEVEYTNQACNWLASSLKETKVFCEAIIDKVDKLLENMDDE